MPFGRISTGGQLMVLHRKAGRSFAPSWKILRIAVVDESTFIIGKLVVSTGFAIVDTGMTIEGGKAGLARSSSKSSKSGNYQVVMLRADEDFYHLPFWHLFQYNQQFASE